MFRSVFVVDVYFVSCLQLALSLVGAVNNIILPSSSILVCDCWWIRKESLVVFTHFGLAFLSCVKVCACGLPTCLYFSAFYGVSELLSADILYTLLAHFLHADVGFFCTFFSFDLLSSRSSIFLHKFRIQWLRRMRNALVLHTSFTLWHNL